MGRFSGEFMGFDTYADARRQYYKLVRYIPEDLQVGNLVFISAQC
jgi:hypothetical protein